MKINFYRKLSRKSDPGRHIDFVTYFYQSICVQDLKGMNNFFFFFVFGILKRISMKLKTTVVWPIGFFFSITLHDEEDIKCQCLL